MRRRLKDVAERLLCASGLPVVARSVRRSRTVVLAYHNIVPAGERARGDLSLHLPQRAFARQVELLARTHEVVPLSAVFAGREEPTRPRAVITFDDACQGALTAGLSELARVGVPATIFVCPAFLGGRSFWWDSLAGADGVRPELRAHALDELRGDDTAVRGWAHGRLDAEREVPQHQTAASESQLSSALARGGITLASHSWGHRNLTRLADAELREELVRPLVWLRERFEHVVDWLSYPYGLSSPAVEKAAASAGYTGAFRIDGGWLPPGEPNRFALPRVNVPAGLSLRGFELRVSGLIER